MRNPAYPIALTFAFLSIHARVLVGAGWTNASNGLTGSVPGVTALVIDRSTGSTLYALTSADNIFKSTDGGANWEALGNIAGVSVLALDPTSASTIYAGTAHGVVTTIDGGASWVSAGLSDTSVSNLAVDPITPSTLYAGGNGHLYKSIDRGRSWTALNLGPFPGAGGPGFIAALVLDPLTPSTLYVAAGSSVSGNFLKSLDGGESWNVIGANAGRFFSGPPLVIDPSAPSTLYSINPLRKSMDGGISWTGLTDPTTNAGYVAAALAIDPRNSNTLYLSGQAIFKSTDGGQSWNTLDTTFPLAGSLVFGPDSSTIYAGTGGGVFKSPDAGANWGETNAGLRVLSIRMLVGDPANTATIYAGGDEGLFKSVDGGANWTQRATFQVFCCQEPPGVQPPPFPPVAQAEVHSLLIDFANPNTLYLETARPGGCSSGDVNLHKSTDGGASWSDLRLYQIDGCETSGAQMAMDSIDPNALYLTFGDGYAFDFTVFKTTDGGAHWSNLGANALGAASEINALVIDPHTPATLYAATDIGVFHSTDGGASFIPAGFANMTVVLLAIDPVRSNVLYAATSGLLYKSTDSGASWSPINLGLDEVVAAHAPVNALLVDPDQTNVLYLATSGFGVFKSSDGGATWAAFNDGLTFLDVRSLAIVRGGSPAVYAGTPGGVFKIVDSSKLAIPIRHR